MMGRLFGESPPFGIRLALKSSPLIGVPPDGRERDKGVFSLISPPGCGAFSSIWRRGARDNNSEVGVTVFSLRGAMGFSLRTGIGFFPTSRGVFSLLFVIFLLLILRLCLTPWGRLRGTSFIVGRASSWPFSLTKEISKGMD